MSLIIHKKPFKSNALTFLLGTVSISAFLGTILYHATGWKQSITTSSLLFVIAGIIAFALSRKHAESHEKRDIFFWLSNAIIFIGALFCFRYAIEFTAIGNEWIGSPWQVLSKKFILAIFFVITLTSLAVAHKKISSRVFFFIILLLLSINAIVFTHGFGFDIFVHAATVDAWLSHGTITPITILYNGFHSIIAGFASITSLPVIDLISWTTPFLGAGILGAIYSRMQDDKKLPFVLAGFLLIFSSLFTTSTPQALGHFLLFGLIIEIWQNHESTTIKERILHALIALGILSIHPLSGIPALLFFLWSLKPRNILLGLATIIGPALALIVGAHGKVALTNLNIREIFIPTISAFQPFVLTKLSYSAALLAPLFLFILALIGYKKNRAEQNFFIFSLLLLAAGILTRAVRIENIIGYEQSAFASRIILAAYFFLIPPAAESALEIWNNVTSRAARVAIFTTTIAAICGIWFIAYPAWNSVQKTKAINTNEADFQIVEAIARDAGTKSYIVLADQPTSAAALATFGFYQNQLPGKDFYFYPIPTGGELYTKFFLPAMYEGVTPELLQNAAKFANVQDAYIVIKPYWTNAEKNKEIVLKSPDKYSIIGSAGTELFERGNTIIAHLKVK